MIRTINTSVGVIVFCLCLFPPAVWADQIADLTRVLNTNPSYKVRLTAIIGLSKYKDPRVTIALHKALKNRRQSNFVRGFAARMLAKKRAFSAIPALRKAARASNSYLRNKARKALRTMCPRSIRRASRRSFYLNLDKVKSRGPMHQIARELWLRKLRKRLGADSRTIFEWGRCKLPSRRTLRRKRYAGFFLNIEVKVRYKGGATQCAIDVILANYPNNSLKGFYRAKASAGAEPGAYVFGLLLDALLNSHGRNIKQYLDRHAARNP